MKYQISDRELVEARISRLGKDYEIDAWGVSRSTGITPLSAEVHLDRLTAQGVLYKVGNWYGLNDGLKK